MENSFASQNRKDSLAPRKGPANLISPENLPQTFDLEKVVKLKQEKCSLCRLTFKGMFAAK